ncbi:uncharacterized protein LACBIDRAFT_315789 [Laccaria bicolor S238N-H82]|uniref:Predicted protein n=1 Tax=Laccaria bicolor (strain S238N-H82 / ATCC MYA-4686) TaxID=486041 RepID=B0D367_LACBS|nr:uncharacterized protein LACBIDRAFT_315789 [Laccaria bicolor S238N-H82]EDR10864.1 predicted protein [Laccaria bicolor S238N-H82]|eukprot:XP_001878165.1 predicted protein [Laccaria bicolor S238N-H82]
MTWGLHLVLDVEELSMGDGLRRVISQAKLRQHRHRISDSPLPLQMPTHLPSPRRPNDIPHRSRARSDITALQTMH